MIYEMDFIFALKIAKNFKLLFRPEYGSDWICANREDGAVIYTSRYGVPLYNCNNEEIPVPLTREIASCTNWEFYTTKTVEKQLRELFAKNKLIFDDRESNKEKIEEFPSPVRLCGLKDGDYFYLADDPNGDKYVKIKNELTGRIRCEDMCKHPDDMCCWFDAITLVYKCNKDGEIVAAS